MSEYLVLVERDDQGGFSAWVPDLPGVAAAAATYEECVLLMREAVEFHLEGIREDGDVIPAPTVVGAVTIEAA
ncbi:type II toxin-antitoxin system HicB family antitoxin [Saccharopolyspora gloriosae]|uniref:type II toxin-antitoxin system HicB family antitoxin n=1 Tax=Saccharopolyspora gloriosae TaxID=455344 RepID=UPI001FB5884E|nr:type II toxin-antitoxin system HicB family antitoxin [Saccharopolyspora gloriosae]